LLLSLYLHPSPPDLHSFPTRRSSDLPMPFSLGIVHGYGFSGAGSNLWTRSVVRALCHLGHTVHVVCQESRPEAYDFVAEAISYRSEEHTSELQSRENLVCRLLLEKKK